MARTRRLITKGVYGDKFGVAIVVSINGKPREFRKDAHGIPYVESHGTAWFRDERERVLARERLTVERKAEQSDTFRADVQRFLKTLSGGHKLNTEGYMKHWEAAFGDRPRNSITELEIQTAFASIQKANSTKRHIRRALVKFYETMNGVSGVNPARVLVPPPKPPEEARDIPYEAIERIFAALRPSRARARLKLLAYIGLPQKQIKLLEPAALRLKAAELVAHPRRKGAGSSGRALAISEKAIESLQEFIDLNAFGSFQNSQLVRTFRLGAKLAKVTLADNAVPYDLRHSFLTELARSGVDIQDIANLGMHATLQQAMRYVKGAASERATKAISAVPRFRATKGGRKSPKRSTSVQRPVTTGTMKRTTIGSKT